MKRQRYETREPLSDELVQNYFTDMIGRLFKILPMFEQHEPSLPVYIIGLQHELMGASEMIHWISSDPHFLALLSILQYLAGHKECELPDVRRKVFRAISICVGFRNTTQRAKRGEGM